MSEGARLIENVVGLVIFVHISPKISTMALGVLVVRTADRHEYTTWSSLLHRPSSILDKSLPCTRTAIYRIPQKKAT